MEYFWQKDCRSECTEVNILFIGKRFYTNRDALTEKYGRIYQLPYHWAKAGVDTKLWLIDYHSTEFVTQQDDSLAIISTPVKNGSVIKQYWQESRSKKKPDIIIASGDCYIGLLGYRLAKKLNAKFVFDVYDKYDEFGGYIKPLGFDLFKFLLKNSYICLFASVALEKSFKNIIKNSIITPNGIDTKLFKPLDKYECRKKLKLDKDAIYIGYFGTLDSDRGIDDLLVAHQILIEQGHDYHLLIGGRSRPNLNLRGGNIIYLGNMPYKQVPTAMGACDILTLPYRRSPYLDMASSCKIAEYLAIKVPIVASRTPNIEKNFGLLFSKLLNIFSEPNNPNMLAKNIKTQLTKKIIVSSSNEYSYNSISKITLKLILDID
ncbi:MULTISPECIES: glycosyltransferase [Acinetobacter]|uniref:glycosyltransferase n=1 Tax=Acinetobacter TaxID=469 RepID=UPI0002CEE4B9|nr:MULTISPECIES: glycosyltransferase [Acinetobacter]ENV85652.1 hypothetical protein F940_01879 [Acinetobacter radioresistens NIPH 2130]